MDFEIVTTLLNELSVRFEREITPLVVNTPRPLEYVQLEALALNDALDIAFENPGYEWDIWGALAQSFREMNAKLISVGAPELRFVNYGTFLAFLEVDDAPAAS
jgi:hypothetical protein